VWGKLKRGFLEPAKLTTFVLPAAARGIGCRAFWAGKYKISALRRRSERFGARNGANVIQTEMAAQIDAVPNKMPNGMNV
jgi:hypothetical protein